MTKVSRIQPLGRMGICTIFQWQSIQLLKYFSLHQSGGPTLPSTEMCARLKTAKLKKNCLSKYILAGSLIIQQTFGLCLFYFGKWPRRKHTEVSVCPASMYGESQILPCFLVVSPLSCPPVIYSVQNECVFTPHKHSHMCPFLLSFPLAP